MASPQGSRAAAAGEADVLDALPVLHTYLGASERRSLGSCCRAARQARDAGATTLTVAADKLPRDGGGAVAAVQQLAQRRSPPKALSLMLGYRFEVDPSFAPEQL